jgi:hypothetical protein
MPKKIKRKKQSLKISGAYDVKMSEVIIEFADPLLREAQTEKAYEISIAMAVTCWNLAIMPENKHEELISEITRTSTSEHYRKDTESVVRMFIERKKLLFSHIRKIVVNHSIQFSEGKMMLNVASTYIE